MNRSALTRHFQTRWILGFAAAVTIIAIVKPAVLLAGPSPVFQGLGGLPGGAFVSEAKAISADGSTVVGNSVVSSSPPLSQAFRWTETEGMVNLGGQLDPNSNSEALGVSEDGSIVVGSGIDNCNPAAIWTWPLGMFGLGGGLAYDVVVTPNEGVVVVGYNDPCCDGFVWRYSPLTGVVFLGMRGVLPNISADGSIVVAGPGFSGEWLRWVDGQCCELGGYGLPRGISADGSVVIGQTSAQEPFRWSEQCGTRIIEPPPGASMGISGVSANGWFIFGHITTDTTRPFIWDPTNGIRILEDVLIGLGADLTGWTLTDVADISADGTAIVGQGINPDGSTEGFIARLPLTEPCVAGDVNGDGAANVGDLGAFTTTLVDPCSAPFRDQCATDVNRDGRMDGLDIQAYLNIVLGP